MKAFKRISAFLLIALSLALVSIGAYKANAYLTAYHNRPPVLPASLTATSTASSTEGSEDSTAPQSAFAAYAVRSQFSSAIDVTSWKMYENPSYSYGIQYPPDVSYVEHGSSTIFTLPPGTYFHWPLLDTVKVTVTASPECPDLIVPSGAPSIAAAGSSSFDIGGYSFLRRSGADAAAGNLYEEVAYDTRSGDTCYHISFFDHGSNGAGLYVEDGDLIARYDAQHEKDMGAALDAFDAMVSSFRIRAVRG